MTGAPSWLGPEWLDVLAGEAPQEIEGDVIISADVWKSDARKDSNCLTTPSSSLWGTVEKRFIWNNLSRPSSS